MNGLQRFYSIAILCSFYAFLAPATGATPALPTERDRQVLEAILLHLLSDPKFDMAQVDTNRATIILHTRTPEKTGFLGSEQIRAEIDGRRMPADAESDLRRRNTPQGAKPDSSDAVSVSYTNLAFAKGIAVTNLYEATGRRSRSNLFEKIHPTACGWLEAYLPGYSKNGDVAVVRAVVGPWEHAAMLTAVLKKMAGTWKVRWYHVAHFV